MGYVYLKLLHVLLAILAVGFSGTFGVIMATATPESRLPSLRIISRLEKITRPAFFGLVITGVWMGWIAGYGARPYWFSVSFVLSIMAMAIAMTVAGPTLRAIIALLDQKPAPAGDIGRLAGKMRMTGMFLSFLSLTMIALMVLKPA